MGSISHHIMPLVINSLGANTHTHLHRNSFKKPGTRQPAGAWFKNGTIAIDDQASSMGELIRTQLLSYICGNGDIQLNFDVANTTP